MSKVVNFTSRRGSSSSVKTFTRGVNCSINEYSRSVDFVKNKIQVLGYGSGANQIKSSIYEDATSQSNYGVREKTIPDKNITSVATANIYASELLSYYKDPLISFVIFPSISDGLSVSVGDNITIVDSNLSINGVYRVKGIERVYGSSGNYIKFEVSNKQASFITVFEESKNDISDINEDSMGITVVQGEDFLISASNMGSYPDDNSAYLRFTSPGGSTVNINKINLNLKIMKYIVPISSGSIGTGAVDNFSLNNINPSPTDSDWDLTGGIDINTLGVSNTDVNEGGGSSLVTNSGGSVEGTQSLNDTNWHNLTILSQGSSETSRCSFNIDVRTNSYTSYHYFRIGVGASYFPNTTGWLVFYSSNPYNHSLHFDIPIDVSDESLILQVKASTSTSHTLYWNYSYVTVAPHDHLSTHDNIDNVSDNDSLRHITNIDIVSFSYSTGTSNIEHDDHDWSYTAGNNAENLPGSLSYSIYVDETSNTPEDDKSSSWESNATLIGTYNSVNNSLDLDTSFTFNVDTNYTIKIKTNGNISFQANIQSTHFLSEVTL